MKYLLVIAFLAGGCLSAAERKTERERQARCASIEMIPNGASPLRPYRVLGPVSATADPMPGRRDRALQEQACQLGADAVVDVREETSAADPGATSSTWAAAQVTASGTAIAYTDATAAVAPPPAQP